MSQLLRRVLVVAAVVAVARVVAAGGDPAAKDPVAKEFAALEDAFETAPLAWPEQYAAFRPRYDAFAKAHPGSEFALVAKMRLLEFAAQLRDDQGAMHAEAVRRFNDVIADNPRTERLAEVPQRWYLFSDEDFGKVWQLLCAPDQPDAVKAALLLYQARNALQRSKPDEAAPMLREVVDKYGSIPHGSFTFGAYARSLLERHAPEDLVEGARAPDIVGTGLDGKPAKLSALRGRIVLLCFFDGGFGRGKDTYAEEKALAETFKAAKFSMFFVSRASSPQRMRALAKAEKMNWTTVYDGRDGPIANAWRLDATPKWFLIDDLGVIRRVDAGKPLLWGADAVGRELVKLKLRSK